MKIYMIIVAVLTTMGVSAQRFIDDIYFTSKDAQQERVREKAKVKNGAREVIFVQEQLDSLSVDTLLTAQDTTAVLSTDTEALTLAEGTYVNGFEGSVEDMEYTQRIYRFHNPRIAVQLGDPGYTDIYFLDDDLWNVYIDPYNYAYVTPTWTNPYYWDYMYRPYAYGSWTWRWNPYASWGWNTYWGWNNHWGWDPFWGHTGCWNCYDPFWGYPHLGHHHHHHHHHPYPPHHHDVHANRYAYNVEGERRRNEGVRLNSQIDRKTAIMGGSAAGNRLSGTTVLAGERPTTNYRDGQGVNTRRVATSVSSSTTNRVGVSTSSRVQASNRVVSTQRRVATTARTGSSDVRRSTSSTSRDTHYTPSRQSSVSSSRMSHSTTSGGTTTSRGQVHTNTTTRSNRSAYAPSHSGSRSSSTSSSYRSSAPSRSSSSSYRSSGGSSRSSSSYSSSASSSSSSSRSSSYSGGGGRSGSGRR